MKEKNVTHHIFRELRGVARCGLGTSGQPDTAVGNTGMTKGKARALGGLDSQSHGGLSVIGATKRGGLVGLDVVFLGENFVLAI